MTKDNKPLDLVVFGATGFTGRLVAEVLTALAAAGERTRWAMAGRDLDKLERVAREIGVPDHVPRLQADAADPRALQALVAQARGVITTVGPYQRHGEPLLHACAAAGTDYADLCGEPAWMARMIPLLQGAAAQSGARLVFSCGFDSIPFDLGVVFLQHMAQQRLGQPLVEVRGRVRKLRGSASGGTVASALATMEAAATDPGVRRAMADPFALTPGFRGPRQPDLGGAAYDDQARAWSAPFVMAAINTKSVHRTHALRGHPWGKEFIYDERFLTGDGKADEVRAARLARIAQLQMLAMSFGPARALARRFVLPRPGEGPSAGQRERGRYELGFAGRTADGRWLSATVTGDRDPGYGSTSKMIVQAALCLLETDRQRTPGGVWTAGAAMGLPLVDRLQAHAGLRFRLDAEPA